MTIKLTTEDGTDLCSLLSPEIDNNRSRIANWCKEDEYCSEIFHQKERINMTTFFYLTEYIIRSYGGNINGPLLSLFCNQPMNLEYLQKTTWIMTLLSHRSDGHPLPMPNHKLVINKNTQEFKYECEADENCNESGKNLTIIYIIFSFILAAVLIGTCISLYKLKLSFINLNHVFPTGAASALSSILFGK
jgi:hypothetical protein